MAAPIIGVTTSCERTDKGVERAFVNAAYLRAVERAGGVPLLLAPYHSPASLARFAELVDGLLLTGGGDIDPARFGEPRHAKTDLVHAERDELEVERVTRSSSSSSRSAEIRSVFSCRASPQRAGSMSPPPVSRMPSTSSEKRASAAGE